MNGWMVGWSTEKGGGGEGEVVRGGDARTWAAEAERGCLLRARGEGGWRASRVVARDEKNSRLHALTGRVVRASIHVNVFFRWNRCRFVLTAGTLCHDFYLHAIEGPYTMLYAHAVRRSISSTEGVGSQASGKKTRSLLLVARLKYQPEGEPNVCILPRRC